MGRHLGSAIALIPQVCAGIDMLMKSCGAPFMGNANVSSWNKADLGRTSAVVGQADVHTAAPKGSV